MRYSPLKVNIREKYLRQNRNLWWVDEDEIANVFLSKMLRKWKMLNEKYPWIGLAALYPRKKPIEVIQIEQQLNCRPFFPEDLWNNITSQTTQVKQLCEIIAYELNWPNYNFIPEDPLQCVFFTANESDISWITDFINDKISKNIKEENLLHVIRGKKYLKDLINYILVETNTKQ